MLKAGSLPPDSSPSLHFEPGSRLTAHLARKPKAVSGTVPIDRSATNVPEKRSVSGLRYDVACNLTYEGLFHLAQARYRRITNSISSIKTGDAQAQT